MSRAHHDKFGRLLILLVALLVLTALPHSRGVDAVIVVIYVAGVAVALRATAVPTLHWSSLVVGIGAAVVLVLVLLPTDSEAVRGVAAAAEGVVAAGTLVAVLSRVLRHDEVSLQTLWGAICAYLLIGLIFASAYAAADLFGSTPVFSPEVRAGDYSYFSFVTLTTTGYGDLVAATALGRRAAIIEAMIGQIFLATTVARLVTLYRPRRRPSEDAG